MATPSLRRSINRGSNSGQTRFQSLPLATRRLFAWIVEILLLVASGLIPFGLGIYTQTHSTSEPVPLNPVLAVTELAIALALNLPTDYGYQEVVPLTNLFWSIALVAPGVLTIWQWYLLAQTGSTLPKRWFGVRVIAANLKPPGIRRVCLREGIGLCLPLLFADLMWLLSGSSSLNLLAGMCCFTVLLEGMVARFHPQRRCLHDLLAGTYIIDANRPGIQGWRSRNSPRRNYEHIEVDDEAILGGIVTPKTERRRSWWAWMRRHPNIALLLVALLSMAAVLVTLVSTQVYIQNQANQRAFLQQNNQQFLNVVKQLSPDAASSAERQRAIAILGTLRDPQALQVLATLVSQEKDPALLDTIQQALASNGLRALPYLQHLNQDLSQSLPRYPVTSEERGVQTERLQVTGRAIAKILTSYSGKVQAIDLSRIDLSQPDTDGSNLVLDRIDLSGIQLRAANLNNVSFRHSQFRGISKSDRWSPPEGWTADLSDAQMKAANLTGANLSHVLMNRTNLVLATLNSADLSYARLASANLSSTNLVGANLQAASLSDASLTGANLGEASLNQADLHAARLSRVSALGAKLQFANLTKSDWRGSDLSQADLSNANLRDANLSDTKLTGANLRDAQMVNVNLRNADLSFADLRGANVAGVDLQGTIFLGSPAPNEQFKQTNSSKSTSVLVKGVDFGQAKNLAPQQIAYICTQGGLHPRCP